jgi:hypothetical protein
MCRSHSRSSASASSASPSPDVWWEYFLGECRKRDVTPASVFGGDEQLANWLKPGQRSTPPLRRREYAWMQLLAEDTSPETRETCTVSAERLDLQANEEVVQEIEAPAPEFDWRSW